MKKLAFLSAVLAFLMVMGCEIKTYTVVIENKSQLKTVTYSYNGSTASLLPNASNTYEVLPYTQPPQNIIDQNGIASLKMNNSGDIYTFTDAIPFDLNVANKLPVEVKIKASNYIDDEGSPEFTISANAEKTTAKIYTKSPKFISLTNYPVIIDWSISENTIYVILK